jgi:hypothetical protein
MDGYAPRIGGKDMSDFQGSQVILMGKVLSDTGAVAQVQAADGTTINVIKAQGGGTPYDTQYVEILGRASGPAEVQEFKCTAWETVDMEQYLKLTQFQNGPFKPMFHPPVSDF